MSIREYFTKRFKAERPAFVAVLRAMPPDKLDYKPHEKNSTAGDIAWFLVLELRILVQLAQKLEVEWQQTPNPKKLDAIVDAYEAAANEMEQTLAVMDDNKWNSEARMYYGGKLAKTAPLGETIFEFFLDAIHHRGQLTAYLRPMGGNVPSTYGPTADTRPARPSGA